MIDKSIQEYAPVGIQNKRNMSHLSIARLLLELHTQLLKPLACLLDIVNRDSDVSKPTTRIRVAASVALEIWVRLGAVVVRELEDACNPR